MAEEGLAPDQIKQVSLHQSLPVLFGYIRRVIDRKNVPTHQLALQNVAA